VTAPWWTAADDAELTVLVQEFVDGEIEHRERCAICSQGGPWCKPLQEALETIIDWRERRSAHSFAIAMRRLEQLEAASSYPPATASRRVLRLGQAGQRRTP
jgi:hypothetical protein